MHARVDDVLKITPDDEITGQKLNTLRDFLGLFCILLMNDIVQTDHNYLKVIN